MLRNPIDSRRAKHRTTSLRNNIRKQRDHKQRLLGTIQVMHEEIAIDMPIRQLLRRDRPALPFRRAQVNDQRVPPMPGFRVNAVLAAAQLADRVPRLRRKLGAVEGPVRRHVGFLLGPCRLVCRRHAQARPYPLGYGGGLLVREAVA